jgi:hypothetical protein
METCGVYRILGDAWQRNPQATEHQESWQVHLLFPSLLFWCTVYWYLVTGAMLMS